jgi:hypothetical protein
MNFRLSRCDFQDGAAEPSCSFEAVYRVTLVSSDGPTCEMLLCGKHAERSWQVGQRVLGARFPSLKLRLATVQLHPVHLSRFATGG